MLYIENFFVCIVIPLCVALFFLRGKARRFCLFLIIGMTTCLLSAYINDFLCGFYHMSVDDAAIYIVPACEEIMKMLPILFFVAVFEPDTEDIVITSLTLGIGFATLENCCYLLELVSEDFRYTVIRGLAVGVMHTVCALTVGIGLSVFRRYKELGIVGAVGIFACAYSYHAIYNLLISGGGTYRMAGYAVPIVTVLIIGILYQKGVFGLESKE